MVEGLDRIDRQIVPRRIEGRERQQDQRRPQQAPRDLVQQQQDRGEQQIELLLHPQRPGVKQGPQGRVGIEISADADEGEVGQEQVGEELGQGQFLQRPRRQQDHPGDHREGHDHEQGRKQTPDPTLVEGDQREPPTVHLAHQDSRDQEPGQDEEDVDAGEPSGQSAGPGVMHHHGQHRHGAKALDIGSPMTVRGQRFSGHSSAVT